MLDSKYNTHFLKSEKFVAVGMLVLATLMLSLAGVLYRISEMELSSTAAVFNRFWIATLVFGIWLGLDFLSASDRSSRNTLQKPKNFNLRSTSFLLIVLGLLNVADHIVWANSLINTTITNSNTLHNLITPFTVFISWIVFQEIFGKKYLLGVGIAILGAMALLGGDFSLQNNSFSGDIEATFSALLTAIYLIVSGKLMQYMSAKLILFWVCLMTSLSTLLELIVNHQTIFPISFGGWTSVIILGLGVQVIGWGLLIQSLKILPASVVSMHALLVPVIACGEAWWIFSEILTIWQIAACILILIGAYISLTNAPHKNLS